MQLNMATIPGNGAHLSIVYLNPDHADPEERYTVRTLRVIAAYPNGFRAFCYLRQADRSFRYDRVAEWHETVNPQGGN